MKQFAEKLAVDLSITKKKAGEIVEEMISYITTSTITEGKFKVTGLGIFKVKQRAEKKGINPKTKEPLVIPAKKTIGFTATKDLKESINK